jgi:NADH-quinone oxidoreductase subunit H
LGNILLTGLIYLVISGLGLPNLVILGVGLPSLVFLIVTAVINWILLFGFIRVVRRATDVTTRKAQAPAIRAQRRTPAAQLPERAGVAGGGE